MKIGDIVCFNYKGGRYVRGEIILIREKDIVVRLSTDYDGKNDYWEAGEFKHFDKAQMKSTQIIKSS